MAEHKVIRKLSEEQLGELIDAAEKQFGGVAHNAEKHVLSFENNPSISLRLPFFLTYGNKKLFPFNFLIIIIHSGEAALAYSEEDQITEHKMVKAYMVRQKQGKSQIKHLKTKGKSKAGSRVRLAGTDHFFEEINEKISEWLDYYDVGKIALSCNKTLQPYFFNRSDAALKKMDKRLFKIPLHIQEGNFDNLTKIHQFLISTEINSHESDKEILIDLLSNLEDD